jgi:hypothetical protein
MLQRRPTGHVEVLLHARHHALVGELMRIYLLQIVQHYTCKNIRLHEYMYLLKAIIDVTDVPHACTQP